MLKRSLMSVVAGAFVSLLLVSTTHTQQRQPAPPPLPEGAGKDAVQTTCSKCHGLNFITNSGGNTREEWDALIQSMVALPGAERNTIVDYLAKSFPPTDRVAAKIGRRGQGDLHSHQ